MTMATSQVKTASPSGSSQALRLVVLLVLSRTQVSAQPSGTAPACSSDQDCVTICINAGAPPVLCSFLTCVSGICNAPGPTSTATAPPPTTNGTAPAFNIAPASSDDEDPDWLSLGLLYGGIFVGTLVVLLSIAGLIMWANHNHKQKKNKLEQISLEGAASGEVAHNDLNNDQVAIEVNGTAGPAAAQHTEPQAVPVQPVATAHQQV